MKRILSISLIVLILSTSITVNAQTKKVDKKKKATISLNLLDLKKLTNRLEVGYINPERFRTGVNTTNYNGFDLSTTYFNGISVGLTTELELKHNFSLLTGVLYNLVYSDKVQGYPSTTSATYLSYGHFINIPLQLVYSQPITKDFKVFGFAGPKLNIGLSQVQGVISTYSGIADSYTNMYKSDLYRLNLQIGVGGGIQWKKYQLKAGYDFGITNLNRIDTGNLYQKGWHVSLVYQF